MKKTALILVMLVLMVTPAFCVLAQTSNTGIVRNSIWYSPDPFKEGEKVKIYTAIFNSDSRQLSGTVFFFDKTTFLGNKAFTIAGNSLKDVSVDWTVTAGDHTIFAQIQNAKFLNSSGTYEPANLSDVKTEESTRSVAKTIIQKTENTTEDKTTTLDIPAIIKENTPEVVSTTISKTTNAVEEFRQNTAESIDTKKQQIQSEIEIINNSKSNNTTTSKKPNTITSTKPIDTPQNSNVFLKPFKYTELFALSLFSTVFNNKYIFYGLIALIVFFVLRYLVKKFF